MRIWFIQYLFNIIVITYCRTRQVLNLPVDAFAIFDNLKLMFKAVSGA